MPSNNAFEGLHKADPYPYVVIRWMSGVYGRREVRFVIERPVAESSHGILVHDSKPFVRGELSHRARHHLIEKVTALCRESRFRMCIVFAPNECVYCEPDGTSSSSNEVPSGGIRVDGLTLPGRTTHKAR